MEKPPSVSVRQRFALWLAVIALPALGAAIDGRDLHRLTEFPPSLRIPTGYVRFSWVAAVAVLVVFALVIAPWLAARRNRELPSDVAAVVAPSARSDDLARERTAPFPWWGWAAAAWTGTWWYLAWTRHAWFAPLQPYTFFPLWLGFIVSVNALAQRRSGTCAMLRSPRRWLGLFALSAVCWWTFEWLNRFVENWHYLGVENFSGAGYAIHATLCFSTVLPAVSAVAEWLDGAPHWTAWMQRGPAWRWMGHRWAAYTLAFFGGAALIGTGAFPRYCYPALWAAPLALFLAADLFARRDGIAQQMARGDWRRAGTWAVAAMICGFFWELWNFHSAAKWIYTVPGVERWPVFEMPLLGYMGYLPFGVECLYVAEIAIGGRLPATRGRR